MRQEMISCEWRLRRFAAVEKLNRCVGRSLSWPCSSKLQTIAAPCTDVPRTGTTWREMTTEAGGGSPLRGVRSRQAEIPFPGAIWRLVNEQVVHGIRRERRCLQAGEILALISGSGLDGLRGLRP